MSFVQNAFVSYLSTLCRLFEVAPNNLRQGRRGNLPPTQGGLNPDRFV